MNTQRFDSIVELGKSKGKALGSWGEHFLRQALDSSAFFNKDDDQAYLHSRALEQVWARELEAPKPELPLATGTDLLPLSPNVDDGATSYRYFLTDDQGDAEWGSGMTGHDMPMTSLSGAEMTGPLRLIQGGYQYSREDLRNASFAGKRLVPRNQAASLRAHLERQDEALAWGRESIGLLGLFNHPNITVITAASNGGGPPSTFFRDKDVDQIAADFSALINAVPQVTNEIRHVTMVLMSPRCLRYLKQTRIGGDNGSLTIMEHLLRVFSTKTNDDVDAPDFPVQFRAVRYLDATNARSQGELTSDSLFAYIHNDADIAAKVEAFKGRAYPPQESGTMIQVPAETKVGSVEIPEPLTLVRMDGVFNG